ncbi:DUF1801 domain-containing protein [Mucilaginibacter ginsenosidivorax]|uniref:DUF1801 domain-containing protein n=1 Tax=Mucilaginibacter ginsenosidivorax TaxID=862126 RepID=A0A5B8W376_9SPHI|nr:DUF1801 domain-containing protein [Mucilaginibacter ginsenosidivorax]QEC77455.1 DUF1801 domain-containing protein [Mucilaginibacter ginsenosidivorax]
MAKLPPKTNSQQVTEYIEKLDAPVAQIVQAIRQIVLSVNPEIGEEIKWNAPSFLYTGEMKPFNPKEYKRYIMVMNLHKRILLVFPSGAKVIDNTGLLEGDYADGRRLLYIKDMDDLKSKEAGMKKVISDWLAQVEK